MAEVSHTSLARVRELLARYVGPQWPRAALLTALLLGSIAVQLLNPQLVRYFIDAARSAAPVDALTRAGLLFFAGALAQQALTVGATYASEMVGWTATNLLRADLALHCLKLDLSFHKAHTPGEMIERLDGDVSALANVFSQFVVQIAGNVLLLLGVLALLFREDWRLGAAFGAFALFAFACMDRVRGIGVPYWRAAREANAAIAGFVEERLAGTEDIRALGMTPYVLRGFYALARDRLGAQRQAGLMGSIMGSAGFAVFTLAFALAFGLGGWLFLHGAISLGTVHLVFHYTNI